MTFYVGQRVVCVKKAAPGKWAGKNEDVLGAIYTVRDVFIRTWCGVRTETLLFEEIFNPIFEPDGLECGFKSDRFRPVVERKTDISFAHEILRKASNKQGADA